MNRMTRDENLMEVAHVVAKRGTCSRLQVGAVFALEGRILVTGYNGAPHGIDHCVHESYTWWYPSRDDLDEAPGWFQDYLASLEDEWNFVEGQEFHWDGKELRTKPYVGGTPLDLGCRIAEHAERNAIYWAASQGIKLGGSDLFVTHQPCYDCARAIVSLGVRRVAYATPYRKPDGLALLSRQGIEIIDFSSAREV